MLCFAFLFLEMCVKRLLKISLKKLKIKAA